MFTDYLFNRFHHGKFSYSQSGEDIIVDFVFKQLGINKPSYLDIGAYDPIEYSNTYFFYRKGSTGVCIEPDSNQFAKIKAVRKRDICLNLGIGKQENKTLNFYIMSTKTLSTFSRSIAEKLNNETSHHIEKVVKIPVVTINTILKKYCTFPPDFISIDAEGVDKIILESIDFSHYRPKVVCIETIVFNEQGVTKKTPIVFKIMQNNGYMIYADTHINTIFVDTKLWNHEV